MVISLKIHSQIPELTFKALNQSNGLSEVRNANLSEDSGGRIWIGSFDGLNVFDGKRVNVIRPPLPDGSTSPNITSNVLEDKQGNLWFSSSGALHLISHSSRTLSAPILKKPPGDTLHLNPEHVLIYLEQDKRLWVVAYDWLHIYNLDTQKDSLVHPIKAFSCYPLLDKNGKVTGLLNLLAAEGAGIEIFDYQPNEIRKSSWFTGIENATFPKAFIMFALVEADSLIWLPSDIGLIRFPVHAPGNYKIFHPAGTSKNAQFNDVAVWRSHFLFVSSLNHGLFLFDKRPGAGSFVSNLPYIKSDAAQKHTNIHKILVGRDETLWLSVWDKGVFYAGLKPGKFPKNLGLDENSGSKNQSVASIAEDGVGNLWISSMEGALDLISPEGKRIAVSRDGLEGTHHKLFIDQQGDVWAYNQHSIFIKRRTGKRFIKMAFNFKRLYNILQVSARDFLLICPEGIFGFSKGEAPKNYAGIEPMLALPNVFNAFLDHAGTLFISDEIDKLWICKQDNHSFKQIKEINGTGYSNGMVEIGAFRWFSTNKGLFRLDTKNYSIESITDKRRMLETALNAILCDRHHALWLSSNAGLIRYNPESRELKHYTLSDGLQGLQFLEGSACTLAGGRLAFGGVNGINVFHPDSIQDNPDPPLLHFTDLIVNDTGSISSNPAYLPKLSFNYDSRTLSFYFVGIDYTAPDEVQYKYRLKGFEHDPVDGGATGFARYAQLPAGNYTFQVWAANSDGVWTPKPLELQFAILPPWYATWWARSLQWLIALGLLFAFYKNRINQIRRKAAAGQKEAEFRQKEAESKQLAAELQNAVLRLQMNPHFIFNSMNSISSYMLQKDVDTANDYLARFARLMRSILELAAKPLIPVSEEIELLEQYMAVEAMRFEQKFTWEIYIAENLDPEELMIPTMILQPFVENAIWHGFSTKTSSGLICVSFQKQENLLVCTVTDNGIGRSASEKIRKSTHPSKAVQLTLKRLQMLENQDAGSWSLAIADLYDETTNASGTKVEIRLPLDL